MERSHEQLHALGLSMSFKLALEHCGLEPLSLEAAFKPYTLPYPTRLYPTLPSPFCYGGFLSWWAFVMAGSQGTVTETHRNDLPTPCSMQFYTIVMSSKIAIASPHFRGRTFHGC